MLKADVLDQIADRERTEEFIFGRRAWPTYPKLPVKNAVTAETGFILAANRHCVHLATGGVSDFRTIEAMLDNGWRVE